MHTFISEPGIDPGIKFKDHNTIFSKGELAVKLGYNTVKWWDRRKLAGTLKSKYGVKYSDGGVCFKQLNEDMYELVSYVYEARSPLRVDLRIISADGTEETYLW